MKNNKTASITEGDTKEEPSPLEELLFNIAIHSPHLTFKQNDFNNEPSLLKALEKARGGIWRTKDNITSTDEEIEAIIPTLKKASKIKGPSVTIPKETLATIEKLLKDSKKNNNYLSLVLRFIEAFLMAVYEYRDKDRRPEKKTAAFLNALGVARKSKILKRTVNPEQLFFDYIFLTKDKLFGPSAALEEIQKRYNFKDSDAPLKHIRLYATDLKKRFNDKIPDSFKELFLKETGHHFDSVVDKDVNSFKKFIKWIMIPGNPE